jgi:hypothetical protein
VIGFAPTSGGRTSTLSHESVDALSRGIEPSGDQARVHVRALIQEQHDLHLGVREPEAFDGGI